MKTLVLAIMISLTTPVLAQTKLDAATIESILSDKSLYGDQNGSPVEQIFQKNGQTFYLVNGSSSFGYWEVRKNQYCSTWPPNPSWVCYDVFAEGSAVIFIGKGGERFPMRKAP